MNFEICAGVPEAATVPFIRLERRYFREASSFSSLSGTWTSVETFRLEKLTSPMVETPFQRRNTVQTSGRLDFTAR